VAEDVEGGATLSEAMGRHPKTFDRLYVNMVRAGELGGVLDVILQRLADFMEKSQALKRKVIGAMIYPAAVITFAVAIVTGIMIVVIPSFGKNLHGNGYQAAGCHSAAHQHKQLGGGPVRWAVILFTPLGITDSSGCSRRPRAAGTS